VALRAHRDLDWVKYLPHVGYVLGFGWTLPDERAGPTHRLPGVLLGSGPAVYARLNLLHDAIEPAGHRQPLTASLSPSSCCRESLMPPVPVRSTSRLRGACSMYVLQNSAVAASAGAALILFSTGILHGTRFWLLVRGVLCSVTMHSGCRGVCCLTLVQDMHC